MLHKNNVIRAIRCFSTAIFVDPTCIRAYLCRADAYQRDAKVRSLWLIFELSADHSDKHVCKMKWSPLQFKLAVLDYARAIHMEPNNPVYYLCKVLQYLNRTVQCTLIPSALLP